MDLQQSFIGYLVIFILLSFPAVSGASTSSSKIEELIIWKLSDELQLTLKEELEFSKLFKELNREKQNIQNQQNEHLKSSSNLKNIDSKKKWIQTYLKFAQKFSDLTQKENREMQKVLGTDKYIRYVVLKSDLSQRVRELMLDTEGRKAEGTSPKKLPPPKVIEE
ncbi:MAG: hypothetical protein ACLGGX_08570 [Bdellovibrionia bacterium]